MHGRFVEYRFAGSILRVARLPAVALIGLVTVGPALAACTGDLLTFGQFSPACAPPVSYCYFLTPGTGTYDSLKSSFWALGYGDPVLSAGVDNGSFADEDGWVYNAPPLPFFLYADWSQPGIDGCIEGRIAPGKTTEIMVTEFSDRSDNPNLAYFAVAAVGRTPGGGGTFDFAYGLARNITLAGIPKPRIPYSVQVGPHEIEIGLGGPTLSQLAPVFYSDGTAAIDEVIRGYRMYAYSRTPTGPLPDRRREAWTPLSGTLPIGEPTSVILNCTRQYANLAYALVYDSGYESAYVSPSSTTIRCDMCFSDNDGDGVSGDPMCGLVDCDNANAATYPGAPEVNDGTDNQCPGDPGFGIVDELEGTVGFAVSGDETQLSWPSQSGATAYQAVRSLDPSFGSPCTAFSTTTTSLVDSDVPSPTFAFYYLVRSAAPHTGSWGRTSSGLERAISCP